MVWDGVAEVREGAAGCDVVQESKNLLLGREATVGVNPAFVSAAVVNGNTLLAAPLVILAVLFGVLPQLIFNYVTPTVNRQVEDLASWTRDVHDGGGIVVGGLSPRDRAGFEAVVFALGLDLREPKKADIPAEIQTLAEKRWAAKQARDFAAADALRDAIGLLRENLDEPTLRRRLADI